MYTIIKKAEIAPNINLFEFEAKEIALASKPGHFIILLVDEKGERIPLNIGSVDKDKGTITVLCHEVGKSTKQLGKLKKGDKIPDLLGPLGKPAEIKKFGTVLCVCGDVFSPSMHFTAQALRKKGNKIIGVLGARTKEEIIFEKPMKDVCDKLYIATDDGTKGHKGLAFLNDILKKEHIDRVVAMGPTILMKTISAITLPYKIPTQVYLIPLMVDGMGMCGACRVTVDDEVLFACVDGPFFDGHKVDFDELATRLKSYTPKEKIAYIFYEEKKGANK